MNEPQKKAFDFASDLTKQLITLSTGIIALTVTFSKDILGVNADSAPKYLLMISWGVFLISILLGLLTLMALTGNLDPFPVKEKKKNDQGVEEEIEVKPDPILTITSPNVTSTLKLQVWTFLFALALTCIYGYKAVSNEKPTIEQKEDHYMIIRKSTLGTDTTKIYIDTLYLPKD